MKKLTILLLTLTFSVFSHAQILFEKGYYIANSGEKIECLIKNIDWKNNPTEFEYKVTNDSETKKGTLKSVKEFGIDNISKYIRSKVNIDRSSEIMHKLSEDKNPLFKEEELFLKVLVEGKYYLYEFVDVNLRRYFYNKPNTNIEQLVYKKYFANNLKVGENNRFKQQLWTDLKCPEIKLSNIERLNYNKRDLVRFFKDYNKCQDSDYDNLNSKESINLFNLTLRPRLNSSSLTIENSTNTYGEVDFGTELGFGLGIEAELILPFNKNKWALTLEPTFQKYEADKTTDVNTVSGGKLISTVDYSSIELPIGIRHYFFINDNSKVFLNASYVFDLNSKHTIELTRNDGTNLESLEIGTKDNLAFGIGYKQNDKYSLEIRFQSNREILTDYVFWASDYKTISLVFGYSFL